jgi:hypothetical protein
MKKPKDRCLEVNGNRREIKIFDRNFEEKEKIDVTPWPIPITPRKSVRPLRQHHQDIGKRRRKDYP